MRKILSRFTAVLMLFGSLALFSGCSDEVIPAPQPEEVEKEDMGEYGKVELAFPIISDIHFSSVDNDYVTQYYPKALAYSLKITGNRLGAVVVPGDFSEGYLKDYDTLINYTVAGVGDQIPLLASYGNHEGNGKHYQYIQKFGKPVDNVNKVNGYNIILVGAHENDSYTEEQNIWLDAKLKEMTTAEPTKPVFIVIHHPVYDTHNSGTGVPRFRETLNKYPQAFVISGHDHSDFSANSFWQGEFTSFRNSYLKNPEKGQYSMLRITDKNVIIIKKYEVKPSDDEPYCIGDDIIIDFNKFLEGKGK